MLELYHCAYSTCSQKVRLCLAEKGIEWISHEVDLEGGEQTRPDFLAINPNGTVPAAVWHGQSIIESSVICEFVDEAFDGPRLVPEHPVERARMRAWLRFIDEIASPAIRVPSLGGKILQRMQAMPVDAFAAAVSAKPIRQFTFQKLGQSGFSLADRQASDLQLRMVIRRMENALRDAEWLLGTHYTIADACMTPVIQRLSDLGLVEYWAEAPDVSDWIDRMRARPSFQIAYYTGSYFIDEIAPDWASRDAISAGRCGRDR